MATSTFKSLVDTTFDSVEGYRMAAQKADNPKLRQALQQRAQQRETTLGQMNAELQRQGDELVTKGTVTGEVHQMWASISTMFENNDEAAAERVEEGEDYIKGKFEDALEDDDLAPEERQVVQQCFSEICEGEQFGDMIERQFD
ncbi:MAG: PA2169 family four-helix-bundle protein [Erythrobacter sp.]